MTNGRKELAVTKTNKSNPSVADLAASAKSSEEHLVVVQMIERELQAVQDAQSALLKRRGDVVLSGENVDDYTRQVVEGTERINTLEAGLVTARDRYDRAVQSEADENLQFRAGAIKDRDLPALKEAYTQLHAAMNHVSDLANRIDEIGLNVLTHNGLVKNRGRADLTVSIDAVRADVCRELGGLDAVADRVERMTGESDEAFILRRANAEERARSAVERSDPLRNSAVMAISAIQKAAMNMDAHQRARNMRLVNAQTFISNDGQVVEKITEADPSFQTKYQKATHPDVAKLASATGGPLRGNAA